MTSERGPAGELTARVALGTSRVVLRVPGEPAVNFDEDALTRLFRVGLLLGWRGSAAATVPLGELRAKGHVAFLVGRVDIGLHAGLRAVRAGFLHSIDVAVRDLSQRQTDASASAADTHRLTATPADKSETADHADHADLPHYDFRVVWSAEDGEFVATVDEFPSLSFLTTTPIEALKGLIDLVDGIVAGMRSSGETVPEPQADRADPK